MTKPQSSTHILVTGGAGFIGSHLIEHLLVNTNWKITVLDGLTYAADTGRLYDSTYYDPIRTRVFWHDLNSPIPDTLAKRIGHVDFIINSASASHVDRSIESPTDFVLNNTRLILNMLDYARELPSLQAFLQVSTDEVYGPMLDNKPHVEWSTILPSNPYSASKAAQEAICIAYWRTYGVPIVITNTMNNFGERQHPEKFVPKTIRALQRGEKVTIHGNISNIGSRFYMHARNHADALLYLLNHNVVVSYPSSTRPARFNVVGDIRLSNLEMAKLLAVELNKNLDYELVDFHRSRPGHDPHYGLDGSKLTTLGWVPPLNIHASLSRTVAWMAKHPEWT